MQVWRVRRTAGLPSLLWDQEMPRSLSPEQTPPSEEDLAEAERLKTEGERGFSMPGGDSRPVGRARPAGPGAVE